MIKEAGGVVDVFLLLYCFNGLYTLEDTNLAGKHEEQVPRVYYNETKREESSTT